MAGERTCGCGGEIRYKVVTQRKKRGQFREILHVTQGRCTVCKKKFILNGHREEAVRSKEQGFFL